MKVLVVLCLATVVFAKPEKKQIGMILGEAAKIAECEFKGHEAACQACCDEKFTGLLAFAEKPACHAACKILPDRKKREEPQNRLLLEEAAKIAKCEITGHESLCMACCDETFTGLLAFVEKPACHLACKILPNRRKREEPQNRLVLGEAVKIAKCEITGHESLCMACCDETFTGLLAFVEKPACHLACKILPNRRKRQIGMILGEAAKIAECEFKGHEAACQACCDEKFTGLLAFAEKPACHAACKILPDRRKREEPQNRLVLGEAVKIAKCEITGHESLCMACCDETFTGLLAFVEKPACHLACKILPNRRKRQLNMLIGEAAKIAECEITGHETTCIACCDQKFTGLLAFAEKPACHAACKILP